MPERILKDRYRLIAELGSGGMGVTYRAWDAVAGIPVVVKMPRMEKQHDSVLLDRFKREIEAMRAVPHPSIVPITDAGTDQGLPFAVMKLLPGGSLADYRRRAETGKGARNPPGMLCCWLRGVAAALDHIHGRGMIHRDIKPGNIFLDGFLRPFLGDFGIAKFIDESLASSAEQALTLATNTIGTVEYMAPELFRAKPLSHARGDQYALAITVYEMLVGEKPFIGEPGYVIVAHATLTVPALDERCPDLPRSACLAVHRALSKDPDQRFPTCVEFAEAVLRDIEPLTPEPGVVRLLCPGCKNILKLPQQSAGRDGRCPKCQSQIDVAPDLESLWLKSESRASRPATPAGGGGSDREPEPTVYGGYAWIIVAVTLALGHLVGDMANVPRVVQSGIALAAIAAFAAMKTSGSRRPSPKAIPDQGKKPDARREEPPQVSPKTATPSETTIPEQAFSRQPRHNSIDMTFMPCPAGTFLMGDAEGAADETPHRITISKPFFIGTFPVTYGQWCRVMSHNVDPLREENAPVTRVSWDDAAEFCRRLTRLQPEMEAGRSYRLPSEAEWEYACRAGSTTAYPWGDDRKRITVHCWYVGNAGGRPQKVGQKRGNPWGLHDMLGNVWEWCGDWYAEDFYTRSPQVDPVGPDTGVRRVIRGGGWGDSAPFCRSACRGKESPENQGSGIGFRVVCSSDGPWK